MFFVANAMCLLFLAFFPLSSNHDSCIKDRTMHLRLGNGGGNIVPPSTIETRRGNSVSTAYASKANEKTWPHLTSQPAQTIEEIKSRHGNSVSTPRHRLQTPFLRTTFPRLLKNEAFCPLCPAPIGQESRMFDVSGPTQYCDTRECSCATQLQYATKVDEKISLTISNGSDLGMLADKLEPKWPIVARQATA